MEVSAWDTLLVACFALGGVLVSEGLGWVLVYRREPYASLSADVTKIARRIDRTKASNGGSAMKGGRQKSDEEALKDKSAKVGWERTKAGMASALLHFVVLPMVHRRFEGVAVAKLPFEPILFLRTLAHQTLATDDPYDCSVMFLYFLFVGCLRTLVPRLLGTGAPAGMPQQQNAFSTAAGQNEQ